MSKVSLNEEQEHQKDSNDYTEEVKLDAKIEKLIGNTLKPTTSHNYFHGHECHMDSEDLSVNNIKLSPILRVLFEFATVRITDARALILFRSYAALCAEKYRHYMYYPCSIHPFSKLRSFLEVSVLIVMIFQGLLLALHYTKVDAGLKEPYVMFTYFSDFHYIFHIIINFFTGFVQGSSQKVIVMDLKKIALNYVTTWFILDILGALTFIPLLMTTYTENPTIYFVTETSKLLRLPRAVKYLRNLLHNKGASMVQKIIAEVMLSIVMFLSWNIYFQFAMEYTIEGTTTPTNPRPCSWLTYGKKWNKSWNNRFQYALERGVGMLTTNTNIKVMDDLGCFEIFFVISWFLSKMLIFHFALKYVILLFGTESARSKYYIMHKQVQYYMVQRKLPERLKKKILKFYAIRFHSKYFIEARLLNAMTGQLHDDVLMHKGREIIKDLDFLKLLPRSLLMRVIFKLKGVIFIAGDIIFKINTVGDCLYFVDKGTVALYTDSAQEVCHVEDGDFFGSMLPNARFRCCTAVAVTNCELYRLDKEDFDTTIAYYPNVLDIITKMSIEKIEKICVTDEHRKADMKNAEKNMWS